MTTSTTSVLAPQVIGYRKSGAPIWLCQGGSPAATLAENPLLRELRAKRQGLKDIERDTRAAIDKAPASGARELRTMLNGTTAEIAALDDRIAELTEADTRDNAARAAYSGGTETATQQRPGSMRSRAQVVEQPIYFDPDKNPDTPSFFRDLYRARNLGDWEAADRLRRSQLDTVKMNYRALGNTGGAGGSGGELAPPGWVVDEFVRLARPSRVTADLFTKQPMPENVSSINVPKVLTGTTTALQTTQNTALSQTDLTTGAVSSPIDTIGGKQVVAQQLLDQGGGHVDRMILGDLADDYAMKLDVQALTSPGTGNTYRGLTAGAGVGSTTYTTASPKVIDQTTPANSFYNAIIRAANAGAIGRRRPATAIVLSPNRWSWVLEALDGNGRPLVLSDGSAFNALGIQDAVAAEGRVGTLANLPVYVDPNIPSNLGAGTNQDEVFVMRAEDVWLWESPLQIESFRETLADSLSVLFRAFAYSAMVPDRYGPAVNVITGTGLIQPTL